MVERGQGGQQWLTWPKMLDQEEDGGFEFVCCFYSCVDPIGVCDVRSCAFAKQLYLGGCWTSHDSVSFGTGCKWHCCCQRQTHKKNATLLSSAMVAFWWWQQHALIGVLSG